MSNQQSNIIKNLCNWLKNEKFLIENLRVFESENLSEGRCVLSTKEFHTDDIILQVPLKFLINYTSSFDILELKLFYEWCSSLNNSAYQLTRLDALYLYLMYEYTDSNSFLYNFIATFPREYDTPENFHESIISALALNLREVVETRLNNLKLKFENLKKLLNAFTNEFIAA